jgi:hypothetical protein
MSSAGKPTTRLDGPRDEWEYKVIHTPIDFIIFSGPNIQPEALQETLATAGSDGWELVNTVDVNAGRGVTSALLFIFKRPYRPDRYISDV